MYSKLTACIVAMPQVSFLSIPIYSMLPAVQEWVIEKGWTRAYARVSDVGLARHIAYFAAFMLSVEFGVYWMHRLLHDVQIGYRCLPEPASGTLMIHVLVVFWTWARCRVSCC